MTATRCARYAAASASTCRPARGARARSGTPGSAAPLDAPAPSPPAAQGGGWPPRARCRWSGPPLPASTAAPAPECTSSSVSSSSADVDVLRDEAAYVRPVSPPGSSAPMVHACPPPEGGPGQYRPGLPPAPYGGVDPAVAGSRSHLTTLAPGVRTLLIPRESEGPLPPPTSPLDPRGDPFPKLRGRGLVTRLVLSVALIRDPKKDYGCDIPPFGVNSRLREAPPMLCLRLESLAPTEESLCWAHSAVGHDGSTREAPRFR